MRWTPCSEAMTGCGRAERAYLQARVTLLDMTEGERGFLDRWQHDPRGYNDDLEPLRERMPIYLKIFGIGVAAASGFGLTASLLTDLSVAEGMGYSLITMGTILLLISGARGGGFSNIGVGAFEAVVGGRNRADDDYVEDSDLRRGRATKRRDPIDRLRRGLRPPANPGAFWQAIAGVIFLTAGVPLTF